MQANQALKEAKAAREEAEAAAVLVTAMAFDEGASLIAVAHYLESSIDRESELTATSSVRTRGSSGTILCAQDLVLVEYIILYSAFARSIAP